MIKRRPRSRLESWKADVEFRVPCAEPGIAFQVRLILEGTRPERIPEPQAIALAQAAAERAIADAARQYSVLDDEAAAIAATAAVWRSKLPRRGPSIEQVTVRLRGNRDAQVELVHLEVLRRIAGVAGPEAVEQVARAMSIRHVVLDDHASTIAHFLLDPPHGFKLDQFPEAAADLRRSIDDYQPDESWIRTAEALNLLVSKKTSPELQSMLRELSRWIAKYSPELSEQLGDALDKPGETAPAENPAGDRD
ncbi:hypothetical protein [Glycomyces albidus]|uniref:Uncharacterized protein n=1 Tax=Glycomyces albidus TaxID=2656774 RepID=A0A6L5G4R8_9ACTN|nr:hypothetical protein [Glycomyces albidus]MQM24629.1 hypothetical protein [Glycomyces albidus]